jgi:hypothetical protein
MADSKNPTLGASLRTSEDAGQITHNKFVFDFSKAYAPAAIAATDRIFIGMVPAGEVLMPHLCLLSLPNMDTSGPTGDYSIGAGTDDDALKGSAAAETAVVLSGEDFILTNPVGSKTADTPIYLYFINAVNTPPVTGKVIFDQITRPWNDDIDG